MNDLKQFILDLNDAWVEQRYDDLYGFYHDDVVMLPPGLSEPMVGVEAVVQSYREFGKIGKLHGFKVTDFKQFDYGSAVMCHMRFEVDYQIGTDRFQEEGLEVYTVVAADSKLQVVWRTQIPLKAD